MTLALSTRTPVTAVAGLPAGIRDLESLEPRALVLEARVGASPAEVATEVQASGRPVLAVLGAALTPGAAAFGPPTLDQPGEEGVRAFEDLAATRDACAKIGARRLVVPVADGGIANARNLLNDLGGNPEEHLALFREEHRLERERAMERLCRRLHGLGRSDGPSLLVLPSAHPGCLLDPETLGWLLEELPGIGCALDSGSLSLRAAQGDAPLQTWVAVAGSRLGLLLVSDHDGVGRADLLLGSGVFDPRALVEVVGRNLPRVLRPDPELPSASAEEVAVRLESLLGPGPE